MGYIKSLSTINTLSCFYEEFTVKVGATLTSTFLSTQSFGRITQQTAAINNETYFNFYLSPGAYNFRFLGQSNATSGISSVYIDGVLVTTLDWYSASTVQNVLKTFSYTSTSAAQKTLSIVVASKNASSTGYGLVLTKISAKLT